MSIISLMYHDSTHKKVSYDNKNKETLTGRVKSRK